MITKIETNMKANKYFDTKENINFYGKLKNEEFNLIIIYPEIKYQEIIGFGGAFTEASGYVVSKLSDEIKEQLLYDYFSDYGINYSFCRTHINSCDFSLGNYAYIDKPKINDFTIERDKEYIIPMIKHAQKINPNIKFLASPWSPPAFMKDNSQMNNGRKTIKYIQKVVG